MRYPVRQLAIELLDLVFVGQIELAPAIEHTIFPIAAIVELIIKEKLPKPHWPDFLTNIDAIPRICEAIFINYMP